MKVKIFQSGHGPEFVEDKINEFLSQNNINLVDIKTTESFYSHGHQYTVLVIYKEV